MFFSERLRFVSSWYIGLIDHDWVPRGSLDVGQSIDQSIDMERTDSQWEETSECKIQHQMKAKRRDSPGDLSTTTDAVRCIIAGLQSSQSLVGTVTLPCT